VVTSPVSHSPPQPDNLPSNSDRALMGNEHQVVRISLRAFDPLFRREGKAGAARG
jgi:hypothetical protein